MLQCKPDSSVAASPVVSQHAGHRCGPVLTRAMLSTFLQSIPFFALIGLGYAAARTGFFPESATAHLTRFVFYFALSAMLFGFAASLSLGKIFSLNFVLAYLFASLFVWALVVAVAVLRRRPAAEALVEAQCGVVGNTGFLGVPLLVALLGEGAAGPVLMVLAIDLAAFSSMFTILLTITREGRATLRLLGTVIMGVLRNPMVVSMGLGLAWSGLALPMPGPAAEFLSVLGAAATPCALFAIGASLAGRSTERMAVAAWLSTAKLVLHPAAVAFAALVVFPVEPSAAMVMIVAAALPVAGNVFILAQHYGTAPQRVSTAILLSHVVAVASLPVVIALVRGS